jgi:hypothetical protein
MLVVFVYRCNSKAFYFTIGYEGVDNMRRVFVAVLFVAVFISSVTASDLTVEGDGLELVAEYSITDDGYETVYRDEELLKEDILNDDLTPFVLKGRGCSTEPFDVLLYLGKRFEIEEVIRGEADEVCRFRPLGNKGVYVKNTGFYANIETAGFARKEVYSLEDGLLFDIDSEGSIRAFPSGERFMISTYRGYGDSSCLKVYDISGDLLYTADFAGGPSSFDTDKDWWFVTNTDTMRWYGYPELHEGTAVFDEEGELRFKLNPDVYWGEVSYSGLNSTLYGSDTYICQYGISAEEIESYEGGNRYVVKTSNILEVYDRGGNLIWDCRFSDSGHGGRIYLSENEEYLCLLQRLDEKLLVFETASGERVYESTGLFPGQLIEGGTVSDDGNVLLIFSSLPTDSITVYKNGKETGSISGEKNLILNGFITPDGEYLVAGVPSTICVYKIK